MHVCVDAWVDACMYACVCVCMYVCVLRQWALQAHCSIGSLMQVSNSAMYHLKYANKKGTQKDNEMEIVLHWIQK